MTIESPPYKKVDVSPQQSTMVVTEGWNKLRPQREVLEGYVRKMQTNSRHEFVIIDRQDDTGTLVSSFSARAIIVRSRKKKTVRSFFPKNHFFLQESRKKYNTTIRHVERRGVARRDSKCADCICWCQ